MNIARFGNGADVVAKGFGMLWYNYGMLSAPQAFEFSSAYERALENFGVLEFSRSLLNIRTTPQDDFLRSLVNRALQSVPVYDGGRVKLADKRDELFDILDYVFERLDHKFIV